MARILILLVLAWVLYQIIKRVLANINAQNSTEQSKNKPGEKMLQCTQCGCHVPESDTHIVDQQIICNNPECNKLTHGD